MSEENGRGLALVTGASMGIGAAYAERLARRGYDPVLVARDGAKLTELAARIEAETGQRSEILPADLTDPAALAAIEARLRTDRRFTLLVNNAGIAVFGTMTAADPDAVARMIDLNVGALTRLTLAVLPGFVERKAGTIIQIASVVPLVPERFPGLYGSTKAFVLHFSQSLQAELAGTGVRVQAVLPGATATEIWDKGGTPLTSLPPDIVMPTGAMVDAALAGLDAGESVTIPSLSDMADWEAYAAARLKLAPNLSRSQPASRYLVAVTEAA